MFMQVICNGIVFNRNILLLILFFFLDIESWKEEEFYMRH